MNDFKKLLLSLSRRTSRLSLYVSFSYRMTVDIILQKDSTVAHAV